MMIYNTRDEAIAEVLARIEVRNTASRAGAAGIQRLEDGRYRVWTIEPVDEAERDQRT